MSNSSGIDVSAVVDDIATHIKNQFEGILARVSKDQLTLRENVNMILNLPIVKGLMEEKKELVDKIEKLVRAESWRLFSSVFSGHPACKDYLDWLNPHIDLKKYSVEELAEF